MTVLHVLKIDHWAPTPLNKLLNAHWAERNRMKRADHDMVYYAAKEANIPKATGKRRVMLTIILKPRQRATDPDSPQKSLGDALVKAGLLLNDSHLWVEWEPVRFERGTAKRNGSIIVLEDI